MELIQQLLKQKSILLNAQLEETQIFHTGFEHLINCYLPSEVDLAKLSKQELKKNDLELEKLDSQIETAKIDYLLEKIRKMEQQLKNE